MSVLEDFANLRHKNSYKSFATNKSNLIDSIQNDVWEYFRGFCKPSGRKFMHKLCFAAENTIPGYRTSGKSFATNASNPTYLPKKMFGSVSEHFANLRQGKSCKISVLGLNALFRCTELSKKVFPRTHPI